MCNIYCHSNKKRKQDLTWKNSPLRAFVSSEAGGWAFFSEFHSYKILMDWERLDDGLHQTFIILLADIRGGRRPTVWENTGTRCPTINIWLTQCSPHKYYTLMWKTMVMAEEMDWWDQLTTALIVRFKWHTFHSCAGM